MGDQRQPLYSSFSLCFSVNQPVASAKTGVYSAAQILDYIVRTYPYNSSGPLIERETGKFREDMGGSCAQQLRQTRLLLSDIGVEMQFLRARNGSVHHAGIAQFGNNTLFLDPSKSQKAPISVTDLLERKRPLFSEAFPNNSRTRRIITLAPTGDTTFDEHVTTYNARTGPNGKTDTESFDISGITPNPPDSDLDCQLACDSKSIQMVAVLHNEDVATLKIDQKRIAIRMLGDAPVKNAAEGRQIFRAIAESCGVTHRELIEYLKLGHTYLQQSCQSM